jgi:hypothetical protein
MSNPGEYPQPLPRKTLVNVPVVSGYVTSRLRANDDFPPVISGENTRISVLIENVGNTYVEVKLRQTNDRSISGTRIDVISGLQLQPGGRRYVTSTSPFQKYLELFCYGPSQRVGQIRMQIESLREWNQCGFDKVADQTFYPPQLWQAETAYPEATELPSAITPQYNYP